MMGREFTRERVRQRDNWTCRDCKKVWVKGNRRFDCHHINGLCGKRSRGYDRISEIHTMVTLCHKCHCNRPEHTSRHPDFVCNREFERNIQMVSLRGQGMTFRQIGERYGLTRQRIEQITSRHEKSREFPIAPIDETP